MSTMIHFDTYQYFTKLKKVEMKNLDSKVDTHGYMLGIIIAGIGSLILKAFF